MDGQLAIEHNHAALKRIFAALITMAGLSGGAGTMTRRLRIAVLRLLRPAEAATRRLIITLAREVKVALPQPRKPKRTPGIPAPMWSLAYSAASAPQAKGPARAAGQPMPPAFPLLDPLRHPQRKRRRRGGSFPRISGFDPDAAPPVPIPPPPSPDDLLDAGRLAARLAALGAALDDLPAQARRFARWRALNALRPGRYDGEPGVRPRGPFRRLSPLRPGPAIGSLCPAARRRNPHEVYEVLRHAHSLAFYALERWDSS